MIFPTTPCTITKPIGYDEFGTPLFGMPVNVKCCVVKLTGGTKKTSIRTDKSASQGNADELVSESRLLFPPNVSINVGDIVTIRGMKLVVDLIEQKFTALIGKFDHYQVDLTIWV